MKSSAIVIATSVLSSMRMTHASKPNNMTSAMMIFVDEINSPSDSTKSHRARCVSRFADELKQKPATASTYYNLCSDKYLSAAEQVSVHTINRNPPRLYTIYKTKPGTDIISHRIVLPVQRDAIELCSGITFSGVVKGVLDIGQSAPGQ